MPILAGVVLFFVPVSEESQTECVVQLRAVRRVVIALILEPIPAATVRFVGVAAATVSILVVQNRRTPSNRRSLDFRTEWSGSSSSLYARRWAMRKPAWAGVSR
jgi:hypothetical protein